MKVEVVVPIGCGDPNLDIPCEPMIIAGLTSIKNQDMPVKLTVAMDVNLPEKKIALIRSLADRVVEFPAHSYFRKGGIWNKIYTCWETSDCDYVAWNGYDDRHTPDRFRYQSEKLDKTGANSAFCKNFELHNEGRMRQIHNGHLNFKQHVGSHAPFMGAFLLRKSAIVASGMAQYREKWSSYFEGLLYCYILKMGMPVVSDNGGFIYHWHRGTIANTGTEEKEWVKVARQSSQYSLEETIKDWNEIPFAQLCAEARA